MSLYHVLIVLPTVCPKLMGPTIFLPPPNAGPIFERHLKDIFKTPLYECKFYECLYFTYLTFVLRIVKPCTNIIHT